MTNGAVQESDGIGGDSDTCLCMLANHSTSHEFSILLNSSSTKDAVVS